MDFVQTSFVKIIIVLAYVLSLSFPGYAVLCQDETGSMAIELAHDQQPVESCGPDDLALAHESMNHNGEHQGELETHPHHHHSCSDILLINYHAAISSQSDNELVQLVGYNYIFRLNHHYSNVKNSIPLTSLLMYPILSLVKSIILLI